MQTVTWQEINESRMACLSSLSDGCEKNNSAHVRSSIGQWVRVNGAKVNEAEKTEEAAIECLNLYMFTGRV